jgi:hypothetical protein
VIDLPYGITPKERSIAARSLQDDLQFCAMIRSAESSRLDPVSSAVSVTTSRLHENDAASEIAKSVDDLASIAKAIDELPIRE